MRERRAGFCLSFVGTLIGEIVGIFEIVSSRKGGEDAKGFFLFSLLLYIPLPPSKGDCRWASFWVSLFASFFEKWGVTL